MVHNISALKWTASSGWNVVRLRWGFGVAGSSSSLAKVEIEVRFGPPCEGLEMEREMGTLLEQHAVLLHCQRIQLEINMAESQNVFLSIQCKRRKHLFTPPVLLCLRWTCNLSATVIKRFPPIEVFSGTHCFHFSVPLWKFSVSPQAGWGGRVNGKVLHSMTTVRLCVYVYVPRRLPLWAHRPLTGNWLQSALTEWFPSGTTCQAASLPATLSYIPQQSGHCQLGQSGWVPPSASLAAPDTWTSTGVEEKGRETGIAGRVHGGSESYVK